MRVVSIRCAIVIPLLSAIGLGSAGCTTAYKLKVDALSRPAANEAVSYRVKTADPNIDEDTLRHQEAAMIVKTALAGRGMYEAPRPELADVIVAIDYGIGPPRTIREKRTEPIYRERPGRQRTERLPVGRNNQGRTIYQAITYRDPPTLVYVGEREYWVTFVVYGKHVHLSARENKPAGGDQPSGEVWTITVTAEDESKDLRKYLPIMAAAAGDYIGTNSGGPRTVTIKANDRTVDFIKKELAGDRTADPPAEAPADQAPKAAGSI